MFTISRRLEIDAAHRVPDHKSKCFNVHGHRYVIEAICGAGLLHTAGEQRGMVLDFGFLKDVMVRHIHDPYDHGMIVWAEDPLLEQFQACCGKLRRINLTPTAENLARIWYYAMEHEVRQLSDDLAFLVRVDVHETPNCVASFTPHSMTIEKELT